MTRSSEIASSQVNHNETVSKDHGEKKMSLMNEMNATEYLGYEKEDDLKVLTLTIGTEQPLSISLMWEMSMHFPVVGSLQMWAVIAKWRPLYGRSRACVLSILDRLACLNTSILKGSLIPWFQGMLSRSHWRDIPHGRSMELSTWNWAIMDQSYVSSSPGVVSRDQGVIQPFGGAEKPESCCGGFT
jgi:hypothetical protein